MLRQPLNTELNMDLDEEILARIKAALNKDAKPTDFQVRAGDNGSVLINLKTGKAQLIYDDESELHDFQDLGIKEDGRHQ